MTKVTIEDISRHTGLSRGTVSRALNNRADISEQTKQRVLDACRQLNYVPSHAARSLATGRSYAAVVAVDDLHRPFAADFVRGVSAGALPERYAVHVVEMSAAPTDAMQTLASFAKERVDTVLLATSLDAEAVALVSNSGNRPIVSIAPLEGLASDVLMPDFAEAGRLVARQFLPDAREGFVYLFNPDQPDEQLSAQGVAQVCNEHGVSPENVLVEVRADNGSAAFGDRVLQARAVACANDLLAAQVSMLWQANGRRAGQDGRLIGQGNHPIAQELSPKLSTVDMSGEEIGRRAFETALQRVMRNRQDSPGTTAVAPRLIERET